jgi:ribonucleoside-diphosphate reductase alpha chain
MKVVKRSGDTEDVSFDKVLNRLKNLSEGLNIDVYDIAQKVCSRICDMVKTSELDEHAAHMCSSLTIEDPDYGTMASRIIISNHHKNTSPSFSETISILFNNKAVDGEDCPLVSKDLYEMVMKNREKLNNYIDYSRDYSFDYFGFKTLEKSYLMRVDGKVIERPQHMFMRVALGIHKTDFKDALQTYDLMSKKYFTHATPTLFNAGTNRPQLSSCFLAQMNDDSVAGIFQSLQECAMISKYAGGIGIHIHNIRSKGSRIRGTNGTSSGIIPMLRVFNNTARYIDQAGRRAGSIAVYLEPWHADVFDFLDLKKPHGHEEERARDLFYAMWIPDLFMERVKEGGMWSLMCPDVSRGLADVWGESFKELYEKYEREGKFVKQVRAQDLWFKILESQIESGTPYLLYKDAANRKSNQQNLGTIKSSNLCSEIIEYSSPDEISVCNLSSICLPTFVEKDERGCPTFNFDKLHDIAKIVTKNLNKVIDINYYPLEKARVSNLKHRPIGIGVQGLADAFVLMRYPFESVEARELNRLIFETIYHGAVEASMEISKKRHFLARSMETDAVSYLNRNEYDPPPTSTYPGAYSTFEGSPASQGRLQFDLWNVRPASSRYDWDGLKEDVRRYGMRNSLLLAPMPTASTSQIMGFNEAFEPFTSNIYKRKTMAGEFVLVNKYLIADLNKICLWNRDMKNKIIINEGSIQNIPEIPQDIRELYKIVWEMKQKTIIDLAADRGVYVCQSQSMNLFIEDPDFKKLSSMHFYAWQAGLKTGVYYLRTKPRAKPQQFTIDPTLSKQVKEQKVVCTEEVCTVCSS